MNLSADALTIWTAARLVRGHIPPPCEVSILAVRADLATVSMEHTNPNLAAIAGSAARANAIAHLWVRDGEVVPLR